VKATSNLELYVNDAQRHAGTVHYRAGETVFRHATVIEPDNVFAVDHRKLQDPRRVVGQLPGDFHAKLVAAILASIMLSPERQVGLLRMVGDA